MGYRHPDELMVGMTTRQFRELVDYYNIRPFGEYRHELRTGKLMALHANINRDEKKQSQPFKALDFMDYVENESERIYTQEEIEDYADKVFKAPSKIEPLEMEKTSNV